MSTNASPIAQWAAKEATTLSSIAASVQNLDTMIQNFQNSPGTLSASDQAALDAISAQSAALATAAATITAPPVTATPVVPPPVAT